MRKSVVLVLVFVFLAACIASIPASVSAGETENTWAPKAPMHVARRGVGVAAVNGRIYAIGGNGEKGAVGTNEEYDPVNDTWMFKAEMPTPRWGFAVAVYQNKIYCIGGYNGDGDVVGVNEVYDPATDTWETKASMRTVRVGLKANAVNGKIYLIGGYVPEGYHFRDPSFSEVYDPATNSWTSTAPLPNGTSGYASAVFDGKIYVMGGVSNVAVGNLTQIYDPETDTWSKGAESPWTIAYADAGVTLSVDAPRRIYVLSRDFNTADVVIRVFDPELGTWSSGAALPTGRRGASVAVVDDRLYAIGGYRTFNNSTIPFDWSGYYTVEYATNEQYTPYGYGAVPPVISIYSPTNNYSCNETNVSLTFTVNKPATWLGYSLDGQDNVTIAGNITITSLTGGLHNVTVYAKDQFENTGASETITFTVAKPEPFPTTPVIASAAAAVAITAALLVYFKKRRR